MFIARLAAAALSALLLATGFASAAQHVNVPSGDLISVMLLNDVGSRNSVEGDPIAVKTIEDYYVRGRLVLPKGSPGYGVVSHVSRSGMFHRGGEFAFEIRRLVAPDGTDIHVDMLSSTGDAARSYEHNGNGFGAYALFGLGGIFAHRGNDILVSRGALLHVVTESTPDVQVLRYGTHPADLDDVLVSQHS
ncbi:MAG TPA: hypothetical protein VGZ02_10435 [Candidatus Baltobacteraceae bacterium]|jgi:hypothetical protein|nr:hypothetical protein [Candidatus Baltobacteraceae bacterium]